MTFLRDIWADLVEKRLWPLAVLLVVAMIAAPVVLAGGGGGEADVGPPAVVPAAAPADSGTPADKPGAEPVRLDEDPAAPKPRGSYRDPFAGATAAAAAAAKAQAPAPPAADTAAPSGGDTAGARAAGPGTAAGAPAATKPDASVGSGTATAKPAEPVAPAVPRGVFAGYRTDLHWGAAGSSDKLRDVTRRRRLDAGDAPLLVYLGVRRGGERALFLLAAPAAAVGDGRCLPARGSCQVLELRAGESQFFDVESADGSVTQYELDVDRIGERRSGSKAGARMWLRRYSRLGSRVIADAVRAQRDYVRAFRYEAKRGVLVRDTEATTAWLRQADDDEVDVLGR